MSRVFKRDAAWWIDFSDAEGVRHRKKVGPNKRVASDVLNDVLAKVAKREFLGVIEESKVTFADFAEEWKRRVGSSLASRTRERWWGIVDKHIKPAFPGSLRGVTAAQVEAFVAARIEAGAALGTVKTEFTVLRHLLGRAKAWEYLGRDPASGVKGPKEQPGRVRFLKPEEVGRLLKACDPSNFEGRSALFSGYLKAFVILALNTGMRRGEILSLRRQDVDWSNRIARLERTKNGEARNVHLNSAAIAALRAIPQRIDSERLFPFTGDSITAAFRRALERAEIPDFRLHDMRHCFASYQTMAGLPQRAVQELLGHKDGRMTARYSHLADEFLKSAVDRVTIGLETEGENGTQLAPGDHGPR
jgi:integrase